MSNHFSNLARTLRKGSTNAERLLWQRLRGRQLEGLKFRRQQPIGSYIVDFVNFEKRIIVELDGGQHSTEKNKDKEREAWLKTEGFQVIRFWNNEVFENMEGVIEIIRKSLLTPSPSSPPARGGESDPD